MRATSFGIRDMPNVQAALETATVGEVEGITLDTDGHVSQELRDIVLKSLEGFSAAMNDDLNTPR